MPTSAGAATQSGPTPWLRWIERLAPFLALFGLTASLLPDYLRMSRLGYPGVDFKVVYVSTWLFAHGADPYDLALTPAVYRAQGLAAPDTMFGHAPVYPPFTYAALWPVSFLSGPGAVWLELCLSAMLIAFAVRSLARFAERHLELSISWRMALIACCGACPLVAFGLEIGNLSVAASAFCILAVAEGDRRFRLGAIALAAALLLKPHLALWVWLAMAAAFGRPGRRLAALAAGIAAAFCLAVAAILAVRHQLTPTLHSFMALLHSEQSSGSMSPASREVLPLPAQITGFTTLPGFFSAPHAFSATLYVVAMATLALGLGTAAWRARGHISNPGTRLLFTCAAIAFGLTATYHRAHDAMVLQLLLIPAILCALRKSWRPSSIWALILGGFALCAAFGTPTGAVGVQSAREFLLLRQAALAVIFLAGVLTWQIAKKGGTNGTLSVPGGQ